MLDTSNTSLFSDLELLDAIPSRDSDTVHVFYVKSGQKQAQDIVSNVVRFVLKCLSFTILIVRLDQYHNI